METAEWSRHKAFTGPDGAPNVSAIRLVAVVLLVVAAGCTGGGVGEDDTTAELTTQRPTEAATDAPSGETTDASAGGGQHTGQGTSHAPAHLTVRAAAELDNVTVTLSPDGDAETYEVSGGDEVELTREVHDRGHDVRVVVVRGDEVVYDETVREYEHHRIRVHENSTDVSTVMV